MRRFKRLLLSRCLQVTVLVQKFLRLFDLATKIQRCHHRHAHYLRVGQQRLGVISVVHRLQKVVA